MILQSANHLQTSAITHVRKSRRRRFSQCTQASAACSDDQNIVLESVVVGHGNSDRLRLQKPHIVPDTHRAESYIKISKADPEQTQPRPKHVPAIQTTHTGV